MIQIFQKGGVIMWPLLATAIGVLWISLRTTIRVRSAVAEERDVRLNLRAILFWGVTSVVLGGVGTVGGLVIMARNMAVAGAFQPRLVWGGLGLSLIPLIFGLSISLVASVLCFLLRQWSTRPAGTR